MRREISSEVTLSKCPEQYCVEGSYTCSVKVSVPFFSLFLVLPVSVVRGDWDFLFCFLTPDYGGVPTGKLKGDFGQDLLFQKDSSLKCLRFTSNQRNIT